MNKDGNRIAVRNIRLCTKDCLCLYVCPVGATDTEDSIIDVEKCIGCGICAEACPSKAISMVPKEYPPQQEKTDLVKAALNQMAQSKADGEQLAGQLAEETTQEGFYRLMKAVERSQRLVGEDLMREAGYMLPQSEAVRQLLEDLLADPPTEGFPKDTVQELLHLAFPKHADQKAKKWVCTICGYIHEGEEAPEQCPICHQPKEMFRLMED